MPGGQSYVMGFWVYKLGHVYYRKKRGRKRKKEKKRNTGLRMQEKCRKRMVMGFVLVEEFIMLLCEIYRMIWYN